MTTTAYINPSPSYIPPAPQPPAINSPVTGGINTEAQSTLVTTVDTVETVPYGLGSDVLSAYRTILAWGILLGVLYTIAKISPRVGYTAIYYSEVLILLFIFATQAQFFREKLTPITKATQPTGS